MQPELHIYTSVEAIEDHLPEDRAFIFVSLRPAHYGHGRSPLDIDIYRMGGVGTYMSAPGVDLDGILNLVGHFDRDWAQDMFNRGKIAIGGRDFILATGNNQRNDIKQRVDFLEDTIFNKSKKKSKLI